MSASNFSTYDQIGRVEDVSDVISTITPTKTPFLTSIGTGKKPKNRVVQWQEDELASAADNAVIEGADAPDASQTATTMRSNYTQIMSKAVKVTGTSEVIELYGRSSELAYQLAKKGKEIKRDLEHALIGRVNNATVGSDAAARRFGNLLGTDANSVAMMHTDLVSLNGGTPRAFSETLLLGTMQDVYDANGDFTTVMIKPSDSLIAANFAYATGRQRDMGNEGKIVNAVDGYKSPFGEAKFVLNRFMKTTEALVYDPDNMKLRWLRKWSRTLLAKTGDNEKHQLLGEMTFTHANYKASGRIGDLS